jgi:copper(I)-binding protein
MIASPATSEAGTIARITQVQVTAARPHQLAAIEAVITNTTDLPITLVSISTSRTSRGMFHFSFNMCEPGTSMIKIPSLIVPVHRSVTLSTKGSGAMVAAKKTALNVGMPIDISITAIRGTHRFVLRASGKVTTRPKGLQRSYGGTVGAQ